MGAFPRAWLLKVTIAISVLVDRKQGRHVKIRLYDCYSYSGYSCNEVVSLDISISY